MTKKILCFVLIAGVSLISQLAFAGATDDAYGTYDDTAYFDGGDGSTIDTSPSAGSYSSDVPDVGESAPVGYYDENGNYHSY
ncbi:MAG: hypothetical protein PHW46_01055 [Candidatus Omnitrophica bacterium]|nr:hypothetical protein [Candidatus Omnitrophota bacterium]